MAQVNDSKWSYLLKRLHEQRNKERESFVIHFIIMNLLSDGYTDVKPVLQQPVERDEESGKREAIDLYFPQINLGIEVDEDQHYIEDNRIKDKARSARISKFLDPIDTGNSSYIEKRIDVRKSRNLNDIITESRQLVQLVEFMINNARQSKDYEPWLTMEEKQSQFLKRPIYRPGMNILWSKQELATQGFRNAGWLFALSQKGTAYIYSDKSMKKETRKRIMFWFPIIEAREKAEKKKRAWSNEISADQREITECYIGGEEGKKTLDPPIRITFKREKNTYDNYSGYQYIGVYVYDPSRSTPKKRYYVLDEKQSVINLINETKKHKENKNN